MRTRARYEARLKLFGINNLRVQWIDDVDKREVATAITVGAKFAWRRKGNRSNTVETITLSLQSQANYVQVFIVYWRR